MDCKSIIPRFESGRHLSVTPMRTLVCLTALVLALAACGDDSGVVDLSVVDVGLLHDMAGTSECTLGGGTCAGVGTCNKGVGFLSALKCGMGASVGCCFSTCGGTEDFLCCDLNASYRPGCVNGALTCPADRPRCLGDAGT